MDRLMRWSQAKGHGNRYLTPASANLSHIAAPEQHLDLQTQPSADGVRTIWGCRRSAGTKATDGGSKASGSREIKEATRGVAILTVWTVGLRWFYI